MKYLDGHSRLPCRENTKIENNLLSKMMVTKIIISLWFCCGWSTQYLTCDPQPNIQNNMEIADTLSEWTLCYNESYVNHTTRAILSNCYKGTDYWIFVGAVDSNNSTHAYIGAYAPASVLVTYTNITTVPGEAYKPSLTYVYDYNVYWYNNFISGRYAFGYAPNSTVGLNNADAMYLDDNQRLSWRLTGLYGGWRAGSITHLDPPNPDSYRFYKVIYYIYCPRNSGSISYNKIFNQGPNAYFPSVSAAGSYNIENASSRLYSIIDSFTTEKQEYYKDDDGKFQFKLVYVNIDDTIDTLEWRQSNWITAAVIEGADLFGVPPRQDNTDAHFYGLAASDEIFALADGNADTNGWWNAVGTVSVYHGGIPAFGKIAMQTTLFIRGIQFMLGSPKKVT